MRAIKIPRTVMLKMTENNEEKDVEYSFLQFLKNNILLKDEFGVDFETLDEVAKLIRKLEIRAPGLTVELSDQLYEKIAKLLLTPSIPWKVELALQVIDFFRAVAYATSQQDNLPKDIAS